MKVTAVIPIRKGSQRVKDKNLRPFGDTNLMQLKIAALLKVPEIDDIVVNTNSEEAIDIVNKSYTGGVNRRCGYTEGRNTTHPRNAREASSSNTWER